MNCYSGRNLSPSLITGKSELQSHIIRQQPKPEEQTTAGMTSGRDVIPVPPQTLLTGYFYSRGQTQPPAQPATPAIGRFTGLIPAGSVFQCPWAKHWNWNRYRCMNSPITIPIKSDSTLFHLKHAYKFTVPKLRVISYYLSIWRWGHEPWSPSWRGRQQSPCPSEPFGRPHLQEGNTVLASKTKSCFLKGHLSYKPVVEKKRIIQPNLGWIPDVPSSNIRFFSGKLISNHFVA